MHKDWELTPPVALGQMRADRELARRSRASESIGDPRTRRIDIWHNILWSSYKGEVFSALWQKVDRKEFALSFVQIAETDLHRASLSQVDLSRHQYPFELLFRGSFRHVPLAKLFWSTISRALHSKADLTILSGYERLDCWLQLLILVLRGRKVALFLDSTIHDRPQRFWTSALKTVFFSRLKGIFGYGIRTREYAMHHGMSSERVFIPCLTAALPSGYRPDIALAQRRRANIKEHAPNFVYVGRLSKEKDLDTLLAAFALVRAQRNNASLTIVGGGDLRDELQMKSAHLGLNQSVSFTGSMTGDALYEQFSRATALVLPSLSEPWGLVVNEAFAYGCPAIVSDRCGCVPEMLSEGKTGFVHQAGDIQGLADKMLLAPAAFSDVELTAANCMAVAARYTPDRAAQNILEGCRQILSHQGPNR